VQAVARQKIEELQQAGESAWVDLKSGIELAWTAMGEAINSLQGRGFNGKVCPSGGGMAG